MAKHAAYYDLLASQGQLGGSGAASGAVSGAVTPAVPALNTNESTSSVDGRASYITLV